jgi:hypothetical protein
MGAPPAGRERAWLQSCGGPNARKAKGYALLALLAYVSMLACQAPKIQ